MQKQLIEGVLLSYRARSHSFSYETSNTEGVRGRRGLSKHFFQIFKTLTFMKNIIFYLSLLFVGLVAFTPKSSANTLPVAPSLVAPASFDEDAIGIYVEITFGRKRKDCEGRGVCKIKIGVELSVAPIGSGIGTAELENGQLTVDFDKKSMDKGTTATHFAGNQFVVEEDYTIDDEQLGKYTIAAGTYAVQDLGTTLRVVF